MASGKSLDEWVLPLATFKRDGKKSDRLPNGSVTSPTSALGRLSQRARGAFTRLAVLMVGSNAAEEY